MKNITILIVSFAMFMEAVDTTILNTAIPAMAHSLQVSPIDLKLALISYLLSLAIFIPISGWVADKFGAKKVFILAILIFTLSSIWCGMSHSLGELIAARILQGIGGSLTMPVGRLIIVRTYERNELIAKMNIVVMVASIGLLLGPILGGFITNHFSWRWIFWINIPVGIFTILLAFYRLPFMPTRPTPPLDKMGFILFGLGLSLLTFGLSALSESTIQESISYFVIVCAICLFILYIWRSQRVLHPIVKTKLLEHRTFRISVMGNLLVRSCIGGIPFLIPLFLQIGLQYSPQASGLLFAPMALGVLILKPFSLFVLRHLGYQKLLILNTLALTALILLFSTINANTSNLIIGIFMFIYGFLLAMQYTGMNSIAYASISPDDFSSATSIMSTIQQIAQSFGVALAALFLRYFSHLTGKLSVEVFHHTLFMIALLTMVSSICFFQLKKEDGEELI